MRTAVRKSVMSGRSKSETTTRLRFLANRRTTITLGSLFLGILVTPLAGAQVTPSATKPITAESMAVHLTAKRPVAASATTPTPAASSAGISSSFNSEQGPGPGPIGPGPGCNLFPAPPSVGATVGFSYFGPSPSEVNQSLVGPVQLLKSGTVDAAHVTITLPLYKGKLAGSNRNVWYILTDVSDSNVAAELGLNFSTKLQFSSLAARTGNLDAEGNIVFNAGTVNFAPDRKIIPGPPGVEFPPKFAQPGAVGDTHYGPLVRI